MIYSQTATANDYHRRQLTAPWRTVSAASLLLSLVLVTPSLMGFGSSTIHIAANALAVIAASLSGLFMLSRVDSLRIRDLWFSAPGLFWMVSTVSLGAASLVWLAPGTQSFGVESSDIANALGYAVLWIWSSVVSFSWVRQRIRFRTPVAMFSRLDERFRGSGMVAFLVGLLATGYLVTVGRFAFISGSEAALSATSSIPQIAISITFGMTIGSIVVLWKGLTTHTNRLVVIGVTMFLLTAAIGLIGGNKEPVLVTLLALAMTYRLARGTLPRWSIPAMLAIGLILFVFVNPYRVSVRYGNLTPAEAIAATSSQLVGQASDVPLVAAEGFGNAFSRIRSVDSLAIVTTRTPSRYQYQNPLSLPVDVASILIPRSIWPSKPIVTGGRDFAIAYYDHPSTTNTSVAVTLLGDSFRYGGLGAVLVLGLILGGYLAVLDRAVRPIQNPAAIIMFVALAVNLAQSENGVAVTAAAQLKTAIVTFAMMVLVLRSKRSESRVDA